MAGAAQAQVDVTQRSIVFPGPYDAEIVRIIDGDTVEAKIALWPGLWAEHSVRIRGTTSPEIFRPDCPEEKEWGERAKARAQLLHPARHEIRLFGVSYDAFSGRVVAEVRGWRADRWRSFADEILEAGMAVDGVRDRQTCSGACWRWTKAYRNDPPERRLVVAAGAARAGLPRAKNATGGVVQCSGAELVI